TTTDLPPVDAAALWRAIESAAEQAGFGVYVTRIAQPPRILYVNERAAEILGRPREALIGVLPWSILRQDTQSTLRDLLDRPWGAPDAFTELMIERPDG